MKVENLKLYNKYKNINYPTIELIYVVIDNENYYTFLYKNQDFDISFSYLKDYGLDLDKIVKDLNIETFINKNGNKLIKGYDVFFYSKEYIKKYLKLILKDKLKNIINR